MTPAEVKLWARLRAHRLNGVHFRNQHAIGNYVVDFCAPRKKLVIEIDGSQHLEEEEYDAERKIWNPKATHRAMQSDPLLEQSSNE